MLAWIGNQLGLVGVILICADLAADMWDRIGRLSFTRSNRYPTGQSAAGSWAMAISNILPGGNWPFACYFGIAAVILTYAWWLRRRNRKRRRALRTAGEKSLARLRAVVAALRRSLRPSPVRRPAPSPA